MLSLVILPCVLKTVYDLTGKITTTLYKKYDITVIKTGNENISGSSYDSTQHVNK